MNVLTPGLGARVQAALVWSLVHAARPIRYRGVQRLTWMLARRFPGTNTVSIHLGPARLEIPLSDGYWTPLLDRRFRYEPEVASFLDRTVTSEIYFLDCGANIGIWSLLYAPRAKATVAVEASPTTFERLRRNVESSGSPVTPIHAAVTDRDGGTIDILEHAQQHAGATVDAESKHLGEAGWAAASVRTVTLRRLIEDHFLGDAPIVIKLDVEGAEIPALKGAGTLLRSGRVVVIYEDHAADRECRHTRFLQEMGMVTCDLTTGEPLTVEQVLSRKVEPWRGYNFLAHMPKELLDSRAGEVIHPHGSR